MNRNERRRLEKTKKKQAHKLAKVANYSEESMHEILNSIYDKTEAKIQSAIDQIQEVSFQEMRKNGIGAERARRIAVSIASEVFKIKAEVNNDTKNSENIQKEVVN